VNGTVVNSDFGYNPLWVIRPEGTGTKRLAFSFEDILEKTIGNGDYTITWDVNRLTPGSSVVLFIRHLYGAAWLPPCPCPTPIPGALWLLGSGLVGLLGLRKKC
jgi:hypothetical protein